MKENIMILEDGALKRDSLGEKNPESHLKTVISLNNTGENECCRMY